MQLQILTVIAIFVIFSVNTVSADSFIGGDGEPGDVVLPKPPPSDPVLLALEQAPLCGVGQKGQLWAEIFDGIPVELLIRAIEDGTVTRPWLDASIEALAEVGSSDDVARIFFSSDELAWVYVADVLDGDPKPDAVEAAWTDVAGSIRAQALSVWASTGDLPDLTLREALWDDHTMVRRRAAAIALASSESSLVLDALDVCSLDAEVSAVPGLCPDEG